MKNNAFLSLNEDQKELVKYNITKQRISTKEDLTKTMNPAYKLVTMDNKELQEVLNK